jgi:LacI family transcriptional regulator
MKKKVSLKDIAQKVGVSTALVSYVLNKKKEGKIGKETVQKVLAAAKELNYRTNYIAKSLKTKKTFTIGLIVADISNPFSSNLARIIEDEAEKNDYNVIFGSSDESAEKSWKLINILLDRQVDGLIISGVEHSDEHIRYLVENDIPFVLVDRYFPAIKASYIAIDNYKSAYEAVKHLVETGRKRIGVIAHETTLTHLQERIRGYSAALKDSKLPAKKTWVKKINMKEISRANVENAMKELLSLSEPVDAILFLSNTLASHGLKYLNTIELSVPEDLAIIAFDESDAADVFYAPVTCVKQPLKKMGEEATKILLDNIEKNNKVVQIHMQAELVVRKSTSKNQSIKARSL